jgi:hypothetical protein
MDITNGSFKIITDPVIMNTLGKKMMVFKATVETTDITVNKVIMSIRYITVSRQSRKV